MLDLKKILRIIIGVALSVLIGAALNIISGVIKWDLTAEGLEALKLYYKKAAALKLIEREPELEFANV